MHMYKTHAHHLLHLVKHIFHFHKNYFFLVHVTDFLTRRESTNVRRLIW